jgi:hypothetical protein
VTDMTSYTVSMRALIAVLALVTAMVAPFSGSAQQQVPQIPVPPVGADAVPQEPAAIQRTLNLSFDGQGNVTLIAQGVTLQDIFTEWTRLGGCFFPNADRLPRAMMVPLRFENVPELKVLDSLLRSAAGYMVAPRTTRTVGASAFEMVHILPTTTANANASYAPLNLPPPMPTTGAPDDEIPPVTPVNQPQRGAAPDPAANRPPQPASVGVPASSVFVPIQPVPSGQPAPGQSTTGPGRPGTTTPPPAPPPGSSGAGS